MLNNLTVDRNKRLKTKIIVGFFKVMDGKDDLEHEARRLLQEARAATKRKRVFLFFSSAPDFLEASDLYTRAANAFKTLKSWDAAGDAFSEGAQVDLRAGETSDAARKLLNAGSAYRNSDPKKAVKVLEDAVQLLLKNGRFDAAASCEKDAAAIYEDALGDTQNAIRLYEQSAERYKGENASAMAHGCLLKVANLASFTGDYAKAADILENTARSSVNDSLRKFSVRDNLLKAGLCRIAGGDRVGARRSITTYSSEIDVSFGSTREHTFLVDLLTTVDAEDPEAFTSVVESFDRTCALDDWKSRVLLYIKDSLTSSYESDLL